MTHESDSPLFLKDLSVSAAGDPEDRVLVERWRRAAVEIRCALHAGQPNRIRVWLGLGERLVAEGLAKPLPMAFRQFDTLMRCARDDSLPRGWRGCCAESLVRPAARLKTLLGRRDPRAVKALFAQIDAVRESLALETPPEGGPDED